MEAATDPQLTHIELYPLLASITAATDLISRVLVDHHHKVAFLAATLGQALGWDEQSRRRATLAGAVHDIGGLSLKTRLESFEFEVINPDRHTLPGSSLLASFAPFADLARIIRFHHVPWLAGRGVEERGEEVPLLSHLIHLADRVAVQLTPEREILSQKGEIIEVITAGAGERFVPEFVEAFREVASREAFWLDLNSPTVGAILQERLPLGGMDLGRGDLMALAEMLRRVIDFRSRFTATHSSGVAAVACAVAASAGFEQQSPDKVRMAGLLHDIGKLVVPAEILEKHHALDQDDFAVIFKHPYYSRAILRGIEGFAEISAWGGLHHERLDGSGYPYRRKGAEIPVGARILAVADTFTALMEDRPYRCGISAVGTGRIMQDMAAYSKLDRDLVALIQAHFSEINDRRYEAQMVADHSHRLFLEESRLLGDHMETDDRCPAPGPP